MEGTRAYEEIVDFIAEGTTPDRVAAFQPSEQTRARIAELVHREKMEQLSEEEASELNHYLQLEHLMRLARARARKHLTHE